MLFQIKRLCSCSFKQANTVDAYVNTFLTTSDLLRVTVRFQGLSALSNAGSLIVAGVP